MVDERDNSGESVAADPHLQGLELRLASLDRERAGLLEQIQAVRAGLGPDASDPTPAPDGATALGRRALSDHSAPRGYVTHDSSAEDKVALFARLFVGRSDVYAVRWENRNSGRSGFQPACANEWVAGLCDKRRVRCSVCPHREFLSPTHEVLRDHLRGRRDGAGDGEFVVGVYPLLEDETCRFLAVDLDGSDWTEDAAALLTACWASGVPAALERSRSGNGAHLWVFFAESLPAALARKLGSALLTRAMESRPEIGLASYDRLFPSQDTLPAGGFGNLIALPLQRQARDQGNTVFLDGDFAPYEDQFGFLSSLARMTRAQVAAVVEEAETQDRVLGVRIVPEEESSDEPWRRPRAFGPISGSGDAALRAGLPDSLTVVLASQIYVPKEGLSPALRNRIIRLAAFQNPEFYRAQAMHLPVFGHARVIGCAEDFPKHIALPRGCLAELEALLGELGVEMLVTDERSPGAPIDIRFEGTLRAQQQTAAEAILAHDIGVLSAGTAFGKTVVAAYVIAARKVNTLVLVHRQQLLEQWKTRLAGFLDIDARSIGEIGGGRRKPGGSIDVALLQSLSRQGRVDEVVGGYGQLIFDECHHLPAGTFEQVAKAAPARYLLGLSATPTRKDGHQPILFMQCGPIRHRVDPRRQAAERPFEHRVVVRRTAFVHVGVSSVGAAGLAAASPAGSGIQELYSALAADAVRNDLILQDVIAAVGAGRSPVVLTERREHLEVLVDGLTPHVANVVALHGGMGVKRRREIAARLLAIPSTEERVLVATGRYLGEGFDDARLDTLFLALPISWRGTLAQYAGRLHRLGEGKTEVLIYDYADLDVPVLARMYGRRLRGYRAMGYEVG